MMKLPSFLLLFGLLVTSCSNNDPVNRIENVEVQSEFKARINTIAGDVLGDDSFQEMPIFFNVGSFSITEGQDHETIVLADKLSEGKVLNIKPISLLKFKKDTSIKNYIISVPVDSAQNVYGIYSFHDLSQKQFQIKFLIEDWFRGNCKLGHCSKFEWQSEVQALKLVQ